MSDVAADVAAFLAADTTDVLSAAKAASGVFFQQTTHVLRGRQFSFLFQENAHPEKMNTPILAILGVC